MSLEERLSAIKEKHAKMVETIRQKEKEMDTIKNEMLRLEGEYRALSQLQKEQEQEK